MAKIKFRVGYQKVLENNKLFYLTIGPDHYIVGTSDTLDIPE